MKLRTLDMNLLIESIFLIFSLSLLHSLAQYGKKGDSNDLFLREKVFVLTVNDPCISESCIEIKITLNFCFHTSLWCLKRFYEGL